MELQEKNPVKRWASLMPEADENSGGVGCECVWDGQVGDDDFPAGGDCLTGKCEPCVEIAGYFDIDL